MLTFIALLGYMYIFLLCLKYLAAKYVFKMSDDDLVIAMEEEGAFFVIKSSLGD